jgi:hypothetical protein
MTIIADTKTVIQILAGSGSVSSARLLRIATRFRVAAGDDFIAIDPESPTNSELAANVLLMLREYGRKILKNQGQHEQQITNAAGVLAAGKVAEDDL